ncbi:hypothetical protein ACFFX1_26820 [Dactylosporangium sucinum]|uniref:Uncharacterized protein n=1 Tax=Dactylosporangium sucinum TaxID=1424081 RepID=A0A917WI71_9ACTN|nr:hypothetical protein [Dactylosporangium sucinum]GGM05904.1 hypothetical protein GCM10007977_003810 [Dactylosporangium sucinum]
MSVEVPRVNRATSLTAAGDDARTPVFVDTTGRRRRRIRLLGNMVGAAALTYAVLVPAAVLLVGGPLQPDRLLPPEPASSASAVPGTTPGASAASRPAGTGKRTTGARQPGGSPLPAASPTVSRSPAVTARPTVPASSTPSRSPEASRTPRPSITPSSTPSPAPSTAPSATPSASPSTLPGTVVVVASWA